MTTTVIRNADINGVSGMDVRLERGLVRSIGRRLRTTGADIVDARGGAVIPGLTDHHVHLHALAASWLSVRCGPPQVRGPAELALKLARSSSDDAGWVRGVGYDEEVAGPLDAHRLDELHADRPVRVQHRSGALWMLNSRAVESAGLTIADHPGVERYGDGAPTGRVWRADNWLRGRLPVVSPPSLAGVSRALSRFGVTSVTDASPDLAVESRAAIEADMAAGLLTQRVCLLGLPLTADPLGSSSVGGRLTCGPYKIVIADSELPDAHTLADTIRHARSLGRAVAVHCVTAEALVLLLHAFDMVGCIDGDRIEHASVVPDACIEPLRALGLRVVTQPGFLAHRGDRFRHEVDEFEATNLYRCASLIDASIPVALSSDAPYGPLDPWSVLVSARDRHSETGVTILPKERISARAALDAFLSPAHDPGGRPRAVSVGIAADLILLHAPLATVLKQPNANFVRATYIAGEAV